SQNADGDMALSLGLVLLTTLLSPVTTPVVLHGVGWMAEGDSAVDLHELPAGGADAFLALCVVVPSMVGLAVSRLCSQAARETIQPRLKLINALILLVL